MADISDDTHSPLLQYLFSNASWQQCIDITRLMLNAGQCRTRHLSTVLSRLADVSMTALSDAWLHPDDIWSSSVLPVASLVFEVFNSLLSIHHHVALADILYNDARRQLSGQMTFLNVLLSVHNHRTCI